MWHGELSAAALAAGAADLAAAPQRPRSSGGRRPRSARARPPPKEGRDCDSIADNQAGDGDDEVRAATAVPAVLRTPAPPQVAADSRSASLSAVPPSSTVPTPPTAPLAPVAPRSGGRGRSGPRAARLQAALAPPVSGGGAGPMAPPPRGTPRVSSDDLFAPDTTGAASRPRSSGGGSFSGGTDWDSTDTPLFGSPVHLPEEGGTIKSTSKTATEDPLLAGLSPVSPQAASQQTSPWNTGGGTIASPNGQYTRPRSSGGAPVLTAGEEFEETLDQIDNLLDDLDAGVLPEDEDLDVIDDVLALARERRMSQRDITAAPKGEHTEVGNQSKEGKPKSSEKNDKKDKEKEKKEKKKKKKKKKKEKQQGASSRRGTSVNAAGAEVNESGSRGDNWEEEGALHVAAAKGDAYMLSMIIGDRTVAGQTPQEAMDGPDGNDWTALHYAAQHGGTKCVQALLEAGCSIDVSDSTGWTPLMEAAWNGHADALALILRKLAPEVFRPVSRGASMSPATALLSTPQPQQQRQGGGVGASATASMAAMVSVDAQDKDGWTALHAAAYASDTRCVALLLRVGAAAQVVDGAGQSPADVAQAQGAGKIAAVLRGELSNDALEASGLLEAARMNNSRSGRGSGAGSTGGRSSKDGKFRSPSPALSGRGSGGGKRGAGADVESGLLGGDAISIIESSESGSDDEILDPLGAISRTGRTHAVNAHGSTNYSSASLSAPHCGYGSMH